MLTKFARLLNLQTVLMTKIFHVSLGGKGFLDFQERFVLFKKSYHAGMVAL